VRYLSEVIVKEKQPGTDECERRSCIMVDTQNTVTDQNTTEDQDDLEEEQLRRKARWLLKNFRILLEQKHKQEEEMRNVPLFTRDDALYKLSGMAAHQQGERVQTSNISNSPLTAAMNVDEMLERMNKEVREDVSKGYEQLCEKVRLVNAAFSSMSVEVQSVAKQVYAKGTEKKKVIGIGGHVMGRTRVYELLQEAESVMMDVLKEEQLL
jgi:hypothetical protein